MGGGAGLGDRFTGWAHRSRRGGRTSAVAMGAFLLGVLVAALLLPNHTSGSGSGSAVGAAGATGSSTGSSLTGSAAASGGVTGSAGSGAQLAAAGPGSAVSGLSGGSGAGGGPGDSGPAGGAGAAPGARTASVPAGGNGGATAVGVTANSIRVSVLSGDSSAVEPACPRCKQGGLATDEAVVAGLISLWHKEGKLPVYGRDLSPIFASANDIDPTGASSQSACENLASQHPFVNSDGASAGGNDCLTSQNHIEDVAGLGDWQAINLRKDAPYMWQVGPSQEQVLVAYAAWAQQMGLLKGQTLGLYAMDDATFGGNIQEMLDATFVAELHRLGYNMAVDYAFSGEGQSDDAIAVQRMKAAGVTVAFIEEALTEPSGFENQAQQIGYHPKYPQVDFGNEPFTDSLADVSYNAAAEDGNYGLGTRWWNWSARNPATPVDNPAATECVTAFENQTHTALDLYNDDAKIHYILDECSNLQVILQALHSAGPALTQATFTKGMEEIRNLQTAEYWSVTFTSDLEGGSTEWQSAQFNKNRWAPSGDYWRMTGPIEPWTVFPGEQQAVADAVDKGA